MPLSFVYLALVRVLELLRVQKSDAADLVIEVVLLRHEVAVLCRQGARPTVRPADRALLAGSSRDTTSSGSCSAITFRTGPIAPATPKATRLPSQAVTDTPSMSAKSAGSTVLGN
jgi:hypothetical protein